MKKGEDRMLEISQGLEQEKVTEGIDEEISEGEENKKRNINVEWK